MKEVGQALPYGGKALVEQRREKLPVHLLAVHLLASTLTKIKGKAVAH